MTRFRRNVTSLQFGGTAPNSFTWLINPTIDAYIEGQITLDPGRDLSLGGDPGWPKSYMDPGAFPYFAKLTNGDNVVNHTPTVNSGGRLYCATSDPVDGYIGPEINGVRAFAGSYDQGHYGYTGSYNTEDDPAGWGGPDEQYNIAEDPENPGSYIQISDQRSYHPLGFFPHLSIANWRYNLWIDDHYELFDGNSVDAYYLKYEFDSDDPTDKSAYILYLCHYSSYEEGYPYPYEETSMKTCTVRAIYRSGLYSDEQANFDILWDAIFNLPPEPTPDPVYDYTDPYSHDNDSDNVQIGGTDVGDTETQFGETTVTTPKLDGSDTDFFTVYKINEGALKGIAKGLWDPDFWETLKERYRTPGEAIVAIYMLPVYSNDDPDSDWHWYNQPNDAELIALGGTTITAPSVREEGGTYSAPKGQRVIKRYVTFPFGEATIKSRWDTYPNYNRYTKAKIQLPFCGEFDLDMNDLLQQYENKTYGSGDNQRKRVELKDGVGNTGSVVKLDYIVDTYTGACVAVLYINGVLKYQFSGQMQSMLPWSYATRESGLSSLTGMIGGAIALGVGAVTGGIGLALGGLAAVGMSGAKGSLERQSKQAHANGSFGSLLGAMQSKYPKITITYPNIKPAENQEHYVGNSAPRKSTVGTFLGFVKAKAVHLDGVYATDEEKAELENLLKTGIIVQTPAEEEEP